MIIRQTNADAQEVIRNFKANKNSTHITFSWDIVDGYDSSSYINYFHIYYAYRPNTGYYSYIGSISYSDSSLIKIGSSFQYTTTVTSLSSYGYQFVMWLYVSRLVLSLYNVIVNLNVYSTMHFYRHIPQTVMKWCRTRYIGVFESTVSAIMTISNTSE